MQYQRSARITLWAARLSLLVLAALLFAAPALTRCYVQLRGMAPGLGRAILITFYFCAPAAAAALIAISRLLTAILAGQVFIAENVRRIRAVSICCALVAVFSLFGGLQYPPLLFVTILMLFLCLMVLVIANVLAAAIALREENDLTI